jgi:hypothetical protein
MPTRTRYSFRDGAILTFSKAKDADPQAIGEELDRITAEHGGRLDPNHVVEAAVPRANVLHKHFEWDDAKAALGFRVSQAREIIGAIHVLTSKRKPPARGFLSIVDDVGRSYRRLEEVLSNRELRLRVLEQAQADLDAFERRYRELRDICSIVRRAREKVSARKSEIEARPQ